MLGRISADHLLRQRSARSAHRLALHPVRPAVRRAWCLEERLLCRCARYLVRQYSLDYRIVAPRLARRQAMVRRSRSTAR